ncbi:LAGLIDADG family homing endonuclease [Rossellomorea arthrocnemi]|jgi:predicted transcriptional regulator|uniref:LAGLIDADG family homing endonuclease n=1 Tax=Rossellomorea arthrocnemi TaxID=2769542 RepID=UPI00191B3848|nr:LAGLIDADG family homing endonuclease [Rossellomorea arthrocnemi]
MRISKEMLFEKLIVEGMTHNQLADLLGVSRSHVQKYAYEHGVYKNNHTLTNQLREEILSFSEAYQRGEISQVEIAKQYGCSSGLVHNVFKDLGIRRHEPLYKNIEFLEEQLINKNKTIKEVSKEIGCNVITLSSWMRKFGIEKHSKNKFIKSDSSQLIKMYVEDEMFPKDIAKLYSCSEGTIVSVLKELKVPLRDKKDAKRLRDKKSIWRKHKLNEDYFNEWSFNMAYILGFLAADGSITAGWRIKLSLKQEDISLLENIRKEFDYSGEVSSIFSKSQSGIHPSAELSIFSKKIVKRLKELEVTERKSFTVMMPLDIPNCFIPDFIRGYFDGDGSVGPQEQPKCKMTQLRVRICSGSPQILHQIKNFLHVEKGLRAVNVNACKPERNLWEICYSTRDSQSFYKAIYHKDACLYLKRKKMEFERIIELRNSQRKLL